MPSIPPSSAVPKLKLPTSSVLGYTFLSRQLAIVEQDEDIFVLTFLLLPQHILYIAQLPE